MTQRDITLRLAVADAEKAIRDLKSFGDRGENALKRLTGATQPASRGLQTVNTGAIAATRSLTLMQAAIAGLAGGLALYLNPITLIGGALTAGTRNAAEAEQSFLRLEGVIRATGGAAGVTAGEISDLAERLERTTLASSEAVTDAASALATFRSISGEVFTETIRLGQDAAAVFGGNLTSNVTRFAKALEDPIRGLAQLREVGITFTGSQEALIRSLVETGEKAQAQAEILATLEEQIGGAGGAEASGLTGAMSRAKAAIGDLLQTISETSGVADGLTAALGRLAGNADQLAEGFSGNLGQEVVAIGREIADLERQLASLEASRRTRGGALTDFDQRTIRERIAELRQEEQALLDRGQAENQAIIAARQRGQEAQKALEAEAAAAREKEAAEKAAEAAERARATAASAAAREAERLATQRTKAIADLQLEVDQQQRLRIALSESERAHVEVSNAIEIENELRAVGLDLTSAQGQELARLVGLRQQEAEALERLQNAQRFLAQQESDRIRRLEDRGFDPAEQNRDMAQRAAEAQRAVEREREAAIQRQVAALDGAIDRITGTVANTIRDFRLGLIDGADDFAARITDALASIPEQLAATAFTSLFDGIIADFGAALKNSVGPGGELDFASLFASFNNPLGAAALGAFGGSLASEVFGIGGPYSGLGGGLGAGLGFALGGPAGAVAGGIGGTLLGGLIGGNQRDNQGVQVGLDGGVNLIGTPNANTAAASQVGQQVGALIQGLAAQGITFDGSGSIRFNVNNGRSPERALAGAVSAVRGRASSDDPFVSQALAASRATTAQGLLEDVQFARLFEQLTEAVGPAEVALRELNAQFDDAARRARQLGFDESELTKARQRATEELVRASEDQIRGVADSISSIFASRTGPLSGAIDQLTFGAGSALGVDAQLGLARTEFDLLSSRARSGGDVDFSRLASLGTQVVGLARELDASGSVFQSTFTDVDSTLRELIEDQTSRQDDILANLPDALREAQRDQTVELGTRLDRLIDEFAQLTRAVELQGRVA